MFDLPNDQEWYPYGLYFPQGTGNKHGDRAPAVPMFFQFSNPTAVPRPVGRGM